MQAGPSSEVHVAGVRRAARGTRIRCWTLRCRCFVIYAKESDNRLTKCVGTTRNRMYITQSRLSRMHPRVRRIPVCAQARRASRTVSSSMGSVLTAPCASARTTTLRIIPAARGTTWATKQHPVFGVWGSPRVRDNSVELFGALLVAFKVLRDGVQCHSIHPKLPFQCIHSLGSLRAGNYFLPRSEQARTVSCGDWNGQLEDLCTVFLLEGAQSTHRGTAVRVH